MNKPSRKQRKHPISKRQRLHREYIAGLRSASKRELRKCNLLLERLKKYQQQKDGGAATA